MLSSVPLYLMLAVQCTHTCTFIVPRKKHISKSHNADNHMHAAHRPLDDADDVSFLRHFILEKAKT